MGSWQYCGYAVSSGRRRLRLSTAQRVTGAGRPQYVGFTTSGPRAVTAMVAWRKPDLSVLRDVTRSERAPDEAEGEGDAPAPHAARTRTQRGRPASRRMLNVSERFGLMAVDVAAAGLSTGVRRSSRRIRAAPISKAQRSQRIASLRASAPQCGQNSRSSRRSPRIGNGPRFVLGRGRSTGASCFSLVTTSHLQCHVARPCRVWPRTNDARDPGWALEAKVSNGSIGGRLVELGSCPTPSPQPKRAGSVSGWRSRPRPRPRR